MCFLPVPGLAEAGLEESPMKKIVIHRPGGYDKLRLEVVPDPIPGAQEIRVRTAGIGVNYADCIVRMGLYKSAREFVGWPITPGFEFSGIVEAVGNEVTEFVPGDSVFGVVLFGAYAEKVIVRAEFVRRVPSQLTLLQAATFPVAFLTAWYALFELGHLREGSKVLVHSAAGGVGSALCQLATSAGGRVFGVVGSNHKVQAALDQGSQLVVDKSQEDLWQKAREFAPRGFDLVLDANGASTLRKSFDHLAPMGRLVVYGFHSMMAPTGLPNPFKMLLHYFRIPRFNPFHMVDRNVGVMAFNLSYLFEEVRLFQVAMDDVLVRLKRGAIKPLPITTHALSRTHEAHRALQSGKTSGKLALLPD
jgi:NADPH:quinone reductase-like Zn-dependent oxidoreductase